MSDDFSSAPRAAAAAPAGDDDSIDLRQYLRILEKRKWFIAVVVAVVVALGTVWTLRQPRIYRASVSVIIETMAPKVLGQGVSEVVDLGTGSYWWNQEYFNTQMSIVRSRQVAERALRMSPQLASPSFWEIGAEAEDEEQKQQAIRNFSPVGRLQAVVKVEPVKDSRLINVQAEDTKPERAAAVANAVASAFVEGNVESKLDATQGAADWLGDQMAELRTRLEESERSMQKFKEENDILTTSLEDRQRVSSDRIVMLNNELTRVRLKKVEQEARLRQAEELKAKSPNDELGGELTREALGSGVVMQLKQRYVELKTSNAELAGRYQPQHPRIQAVTRQMEIVHHDLAMEIARMLTAEKAAYQESVDVEKRLLEMLAAERTVAGDLNRKELTYNQFKREVENSDRMYGLVNQRLKETDLTGVLKVNNMRVLDSAQVPGVPVSPNVQRNLVIVFVLGLFLAIFAVFGLEYLDSTIKGHQDVEQLLGLPFLGILPAIDELDKVGKSVRRDLAVLDAPKSSAAECSRSLRTNLLFMSPDRPITNFTVTSAGPQEGKTTVANALAITMAQAGSRVLLVDTDMRRPRMHRVYGVSNEIGISSVILGEEKLEDAVKRTEVENLFLLPCGPIPPNPAELLLSQAFANLREELKQRYDRVIFDSPPVGAVTDPVILGAQTDGVVLVFKSGQTQRDMAKQAARALQDAKVRVLGAVVNNLDLASRKYGYYYYSYYKKYGTYYGESQSEEPPKPAKA